MEKFTRLSGIAAPLPLINIDTDMIIPKQFLKTIQRAGLGAHLFDELRHSADGANKPDFILNQPPYTKASILVTGANFGCGSSREHAPWALLDFGIRCVIAPSFADIFYNNCFKNGILPLILPQADVDLLMEDARDGLELTVDLDQGQIIRRNMQPIAFSLDPFRRKCLLEGLDDIGLTLRHEGQISAFESTRATTQPWMA